MEQSFDTMDTSHLMFSLKITIAHEKELIKVFNLDCVIERMDNEE